MLCPLIFLINVCKGKIGPANPSISAYAQSLVAEIHHSAVFHIALGNLKFLIFSRHLMLQLIFEFHQSQSPQPFEQSVC